MQKTKRCSTNNRIWNGSITVFLSLLCVLFFSLICTAVESARVQGARTQTANIAGMATFSILGEFEKPLLDESMKFLQWTVRMAAALLRVKK